MSRGRRAAATTVNERGNRLELVRIDRADDARVRGLIEASDAYYERLYPPENIHTEPLSALLGDSAAFFAGFLGTQAVACGAVRLCEQDVAYGEIKRLFVDEARRGRQFATVVMQCLERFALERGVLIMRLETGPHQPEALRLYRRLGYFERGPFGSYRADPLSIFMEKSLLQDDST